MIDSLLRIEKRTTCVLAAAVLFGCVSGPSAVTGGSDISHRPLHDSLRSRASIEQNTNVAKNVILFVGDGMGVTTVTAARIFDGQAKGMAGEENILPFEEFPHVALIKTYASNQMVADSAGTASAISTGFKTSAGVISIGPEAGRRNCAGALAYPLTTLGELAERNGKATGFVTTARVTHATPASIYAHSAERYWEGDRYISAEDWETGCRDIAHQLVHFADGDGLDVMFGGGRRAFFGPDKGGRRRAPNDDLVTSWLDGGAKRRFIESAHELTNIQTDEQVLGLFADSHMTYVAERATDSPEPQLAAMTASAIDILASRDAGYFLLVEGGRIDHGHHDGIAGYALLETQAFADAVATALGKVDLSETLVLVTADHSHTLSLGGYATRGNPILGLAVGNDVHGKPNAGPTIADDGKPFTVLAYANGPGAVTDAERPVPDTGIDAVQQSLVPLSDVGIDGTVTPDQSHGGEDVALYAVGPWAHLAGGVLEQNAIFHIIKYAYGWESG